MNRKKALEAHVAMEEASRAAALTQAWRTETEALRYPLNGLLTALATSIHAQNVHKGFWESDNTGEKIALIHSELSEALEADRTDEASVKIPGYSGVEEEFADALIRMLDFAAYHNLRLAEAVIDKLHYNLSRPPKHGKKY